MQLVSKKNLQFANGYIQDICNTVMCPVGWSKVSTDLNQLDTMVQKARYHEMEKEARKKVDIPTFVDYETHSDGIFNIEDHLIELPPTPINDQIEKDAAEAREEMRGLREAIEINRYIRRHPQLIEFIVSDEVYVEEFERKDEDPNKELAFDLMRLDTPIIGDPLELTFDDLIAFLREINECNLDTDGD